MINTISNEIEINRSEFAKKEKTNFSIISTKLNCSFSSHSENDGWTVKSINFHLCHINWLRLRANWWIHHTIGKNCVIHLKLSWIKNCAISLDSIEHFQINTFLYHLSELRIFHYFQTKTKKTSKKHIIYVHNIRIFIQIPTKYK